MSCLDPVIARLDATAARIAALPGARRYIGPQDGLVLAQGAALAALAWPGRARWHLPAPVAAAAGAATAAGAGLFAAAVRAHGARLTPSVVPVPDAELLTTGPYAVSRHPIYTGLLAASAGWAVLRRRPEPLLAATALAVVLDAKTRREEELLAARFSGYAAYRRTTPRLLGVPRR